MGGWIDGWMGGWMDGRTDLMDVSRSSTVDVST
jgi:hypothetical protein